MMHLSQVVNEQIRKMRMERTFTPAQKEQVITYTRTRIQDIRLQLRTMRDDCPLSEGLLLESLDAADKQLQYAILELQGMGR